MEQRVVHEFVVAKCSGRAFLVRESQTLRILEEEKGQVASVLVLNARDYREQGMARFSGNLSQILGTGNHYRLGTVFSKVPFERPMLTVTADTVSRHFLGPHCTGRMMEVWKAPGHRSCSDNMAEALTEFGLTLEDVYSPATINFFANVRTDSTGDGRVALLPSLARKGDYVELLAYMDVLVVVSACPDDISPLNGGACGPIRIQLLEQLTRK
jgi:uncharacterized protein